MIVRFVWENPYGYLKKGKMHPIVPSGIGGMGAEHADRYKQRNHRHSYEFSKRIIIKRPQDKTHGLCLLLYFLLQFLDKTELLFFQSVSPITVKLMRCLP